MTRTGSVIGALTVSVAIVITSLLVAFGVPLNVAQLAAINGAAALLGSLLTLAVWATTVPKDEVLEYLVGDTVIAGPAADQLRPGDEVRPYGTTPPRRATPEQD